MGVRVREPIQFFVIMTAAAFLLLLITWCIRRNGTTLPCDDRQSQKESIDALGRVVRGE